MPSGHGATIDGGTATPGGAGVSLPPPRPGSPGSNATGGLPPRRVTGGSGSSERRRRYPHREPQKEIPTFRVGRTDPPTLRAVADTESIDLAFRALANETRRGIVAALHDQGGLMRSVDIAARFDIPWQGVSRHLRILTEASIIDCIAFDSNKRAYRLNLDYLRDVVGRWVMRAATKGTRDLEGNLTFDFPD
jgi:DNA-binding transcriptional ArsR family regulator